MWVAHGAHLGRRTKKLRVRGDQESFLGPNNLTPWTVYFSRYPVRITGRLHEVFFTHRLGRTTRAPESQGGASALMEPARGGRETAYRQGKRVLVRVFHDFLIINIVVNHDVVFSF